MRTFECFNIFGKTIHKKASEVHILDWNQGKNGMNAAEGPVWTVIMKFKNSQMWEGNYSVSLWEALSHYPLPKNLTRAEILNHNREVMCVSSGPIALAAPLTCAHQSWQMWKDLWKVNSVTQGILESPQL